MVTGARDMNTDPAFNRTMEPDMSHNCSLGSIDTIATGGITSLLGMYGPSVSVECESLWQQEPYMSTQTSFVAGLQTQT